MLLAEKLENDELEFPAMPEVGFKIVHMMQDDSTSINKIAKLIEKEPGISAKIIKAGNSSLFAGGNPAMTPRDAIVRIGVKQSMNYVLLITNSRMYDDESVGHKELRTKLWRHSVLVAIASRITGSMIGYSAVDSLFAFVKNGFYFLTNFQSPWGKFQNYISSVFFRNLLFQVFVLD